MTIPEAFLKVADAAVQSGSARLLVNVLRSMDYRVADPSSYDGMLDEDELLSVTPDHMCIVGGLLIGGFCGSTAGIRTMVPAEVSSKLLGGLERIEKGQPSEGVSESVLDAEMDRNMDLI